MHESLKNLCLNLVIDQGNSAIKAGVFDQSGLLATYSFNNADEQQVVFLTQRHPIDRLMVSSVHANGEKLFEQLSALVPQSIYFDTDTRLPFTNHYQTPGTLGKDRLAAVAGAIEQFPDRDLLVIDAGTAITYELVTATGDYLGGNIAPGLRMRFEALHRFTSRLPLCEPAIDAPLMGNTTQTAIVAGVQNSLVFEIEGYIHGLQKSYPNIQIIATGGDALFLAEKVKNPIFVVQNLVLNGLNVILNFHTRHP